MGNGIDKRNWWVVVGAAGILAIVLTLIQQLWLPDLAFAVFLLDMVILGAAFYWAYTSDKQKLWWALIPALAMMVLLATGIVAYFTPKDATNSSPSGVVTMGLGAAIMGVVLKHHNAKLVMYSIAMITLLVGILMLPLDLVWKIILIVVEIALLLYMIWQMQRQVAKK